MTSSGNSHDGHILLVCLIQSFKRDKLFCLVVPFEELLALRNMAARRMSL